MRTLLLLAVVCCFLNACMSADMRQYGTLDPSQKSITVPPGGGLIADIKDVLKRNGWTLVVDRGPHVVEGTTGKNLHLEEFDTLKTRYRLIIKYNQFDTCMFLLSRGQLDPAYNYDMSMIDNKTGEEIMVMSGRACQTQIVERIQEFLNPR
jgi:hypothetical protein